jgi:hypothetical protein
MFKTKLVALLLVALFAFASFAKSETTKSWPGDRAGYKADYLYKKVNLSLEQYTKVYQAFLAYEIKADDLNKQFGKDKAAKKDALAKSKTALLGDLSKIFNKEQNEKFEKMKDKVVDWKFKKKVRKVKTDATTTEKKDEVKKDEKKDVKKDVKKDEVKKEEKKK